MTGEASRTGTAGVPAWWAGFRTIATFLLGVAVIVDSLVEKNTATVGKLVVGLLLIGIPSIEDLIRLIARRNGKPPPGQGGPEH
jgi:hypothetical protein